MIIGTCSLCGGPVESPDHSGSILPLPIRCLHCGAEKPQHGPVIDMHKPSRVPDKPATTDAAGRVNYTVAYAVPREIHHHHYSDPWWRAVPSWKLGGLI